VQAERTMRHLLPARWKPSVVKCRVQAERTMRRRLPACWKPSVVGCRLTGGRGQAERTMRLPPTTGTTSATSTGAAATAAAGRNACNCSPFLAKHGKSVCKLCARFFGPFGRTGAAATAAAGRNACNCTRRPLSRLLGMLSELRMPFIERVLLRRRQQEFELARQLALLRLRLGWILFFQMSSRPF